MSLGMARCCCCCVGGDVDGDTGRTTGASLYVGRSHSMGEYDRSDLLSSSSCVGGKEAGERGRLSLSVNPLSPFSVVTPPAVLWLGGAGVEVVARSVAELTFPRVRSYG